MRQALGTVDAVKRNDVGAFASRMNPSQADGGESLSSINALWRKAKANPELLVATVGATYEFAPLVMIPALYAPFHMYRQLRGTYGTSRLGALARTGLPLWFAAIALTL